MDTKHDILFMVEFGNMHVFTFAFDRESAKHNSRQHIGGDPDQYTVSPLTDPGDRIQFIMAIST